MTPTGNAFAIIQGLVFNLKKNNNNNESTCAKVTKPGVHLVQQFKLSSFIHLEGRNGKEEAAD